MRSFKFRASALGALAAATLSGCMVVPIDGRPYIVQPIPANPAILPGGGPMIAPTSGPAALLTTARLYPINDIAAHSGMLAGTVTNFMNGRGEFQLSYRGELLTGEATRTQDSARRGVANAASNRGTFLRCQYELGAPARGTGTCEMSDGARYTLHLGG